MRIKNLINHIIHLNFLAMGKEFVFFIRFFGLVVLFLFFDLLRIISHLPLVKILATPLKSPVKKGRDKVMSVFNSRADGEISSLDLITLAVRHLTAKKVRTIITIGGMSIGFGTVIFLLSLGYGTQRLVVSRVARLGEMKQINVTVGRATSLALNEKTLDSFRELENVEAVIPMISVVTKVNYNNSISDAVGFGVTRLFLEESAIKPSYGGLFEDGEVSSIPTDETKGQVAGAQDEIMLGAKMNKQISQVTYSIYPTEWKAVYSEPSERSELLGYTTRIVGKQEAIEVWGQPYDSIVQLIEGADSFQNSYRPWIKDMFPIWSKEECVAEQTDCDEEKYLIKKDGALQQMRTGFITESYISVDRYKIVHESNPTIAEGDVIDSVQFSISNQQWVPIYAEGSQDEQIQSMYTSSENKPGLYSGDLIYGKGYADSEAWGKAGANKNGQTLGYWIRAKVPLWRKVDCQDCDSLYLTEVDNQERQVEAMSFIKANQVVIEGMSLPPKTGEVLGIASESATLAETETSSESAVVDEDNTEIALAGGIILRPTTLEDGSIDWVTIASDSAEVGGIAKTILPFPTSSKREVVVNTALLKVFNLPESEALGKSFTTTFILDEEFFEEEGYQAESSPTEFTIIGIIPDEKTPSFYLPFSDLKNLGVKNYSQVKMVVNNQNDVKTVRQDIEALGYKTASVVDTVEKIDSLFNTLRIVLSLLGFVALSVAALGMFNTLTVSLLEKTREVGLMKAIGMKSNEVKRLFLAESIVMGLSGGIFGLVLSIIAGNALSLALSMISITKGLGYISLVYIPIPLGLGIVTLSFIIGVLTGLYPSYRATKISALNALRYE